MSQTKWFTSLNDLPEEIWQDCATGCVGWNRKLMQDINNNLTKHLGAQVKQNYYGVVSIESQPAGIITCSLIIYGEKNLRELSCPDPMGYCVPAIRLLQAATGQEEAVAAKLASGYVALGKELSCDGLCIYTILEGDKVILSALKSCGFNIEPSDSWSYVPLLKESGVPFPDTLRSHYRRLVKQNRTKLTQENIVLRQGSKELNSNILHRLYDAVATKKEEEQGIHLYRLRLTNSFFEQVLANPLYNITYAASENGCVLGYNISLLTQSIGLSLLVGLDREAIYQLHPGKVAIIYQSLHAEVLRLAENNKCRWFVFGTAAIEGKSKLGGLPCPSHLATMTLQPAYEEEDEDYTAFEDGKPARPFSNEMLATINALHNKYPITFHQHRQG